MAAAVTSIFVEGRLRNKSRSAGYSVYDSSRDLKCGTNQVGGSIENNGVLRHPLSRPGLGRDHHRGSAGTVDCFQSSGAIIQGSSEHDTDRSLSGVQSNRAEKEVDRAVAVLMAGIVDQPARVLGHEGEVLIRF